MPFSASCRARCARCPRRWSVDAKSLAELGRWPWPRSLLADLLTRVSGHGPAAIGLDILMPEADPDDALLERALRATPAVLAVAGLPERTAMSLRAPPFLIDGAPDAQGSCHASSVSPVRSPTSSSSIARRPAGASSPPTLRQGVLRRVPLVAQVNGTLIGAMAIEMFRVAAGIGTLRLVVDGTDVHGIAIGNAFVPTERDGGARVLLAAPRGPLRLGAGRASRPRRSRPASGSSC